MKHNNKYTTLERNYIKQYQFMVAEYELVKAKQHPVFKLAKDFYTHNGTCPQTFLKYYARYKASNGDVTALLPQKRGPRFVTRRTPETIEKQVLAEREKGYNKYKIHNALKPILGDKAPKPSTIYLILKRHGKNKRM